MYDGAFSFFLKCKQLYMMAMAPEEREEYPRPWLQAIFISSITTPLDFVVMSPIIRNILLTVFNAIIYMINKSKSVHVPLAVMYTYLYDICFPLPIYPLFPSSNSLVRIM